jgi:glycosyltransferase involved in cell wall biosynthesis
MAKVLMVANSDWTLYNFRLPLALALLRQGHDVVLVCPLDRYEVELRNSGCRCIHWSLSRHGLNPFQEAAAACKLFKIYQAEKPDVVHHFTIKPNLYGSLVARLIRLTTPQTSQQPSPAVINTFMGLGFVFSPHPIAWCLRLFVLPLLWLALRLPNLWSVFLNQHNLSTFVRLRLVPPSQALLIVSDGVNIRQFGAERRAYRQPRSSVPVVLMASRMLWDKGVGVLVESAKLLRQRGVKVQFWLAGEPDLSYPSCVPSTQLNEWQQAGLIHWLGHRTDMPELLKQVDIAVLPSYHEGVPRSLLEAAAAGLPLVATDIEGCRIVVRPGVNGLLVPVRDSQALSIAIEQLASDAQLRHQMGRASQKIAIAEFDEQKILRQWLAFYEQLLKKRTTATPAYCPP